MRGFGRVALGLGVAGIVIGAVMRLYRPSWTAAGPAVLIVAGLLTLFGLYATFLGFRSLWGRRATRYGLNALVMTGLVLGIMALVEAVSYRHNWRLDLTENQRHSLAPQTVRVLKTLRLPVKATGFFRPDQPDRRSAQDLLEQYAARAGEKLDWEIVDPDRNPSLARRYEVQTYGTIVLEATSDRGQVREEKILSAEEEKLTNGLIRVTREGKRVIYFVTGHGEKEPSSSDRVGLDQIKAEIEKLNYEVRELLLLREEAIPEDAAIVVVSGPQTEFLAPEREAIQAYVARAGKILLMVDPFRASGLAPVLERYGLELGDDVIIDVNPLSRMFQAGPEIPVVADYPAHPITQGFQLATVFPEARTVSVLENSPEGVDAQPLARTGVDSWAEREADEYQGGKVTRDPDEPQGPLTVAAVATVDATEVPETRKDAKARIVVIGDSDFVTNVFVGVQGNRDFFLNVLSWLAEEEDLIAIRPREAPGGPVFLTAAQGHVILWVPVVLVPLAIVLAGVYAVAWKRGR